MPGTAANGANGAGVAVAVNPQLRTVPSVSTTNDRLQNVATEVTVGRKSALTCVDWGWRNSSDTRVITPVSTVSVTASATQLGVAVPMLVHTTSKPRPENE